MEDTTEKLTITDMSEREFGVKDVAENILRRLIEQGGRCVGTTPGVHGENCSYYCDAYNPERMCAVGLVLEDPKKVQEHFPVDSLDTVIREGQYCLSEEERENLAYYSDVLIELQNFHDNGHKSSTANTVHHLEKMGVSPILLRRAEKVLRPGG